MDREKIIKGLYLISHDTRLKGFRADGELYHDVATNAIKLLKAQEPRVMTPQDFDGNPMKDQYGNLPCWLESREPLVASNWCRWNEDDFIRPMMRNFRPWTSRPTDKQRKAVKWP